MGLIQHRSTKGRTKQSPKDSNAGPGSVRFFSVVKEGSQNWNRETPLSSMLNANKLNRAPGSSVMVPQSQGKKACRGQFQTPLSSFTGPLETLQQKKRETSHTADLSNDKRQLP